MFDTGATDLRRWRLGTQSIARIAVPEFRDSARMAAIDRGAPGSYAFGMVDQETEQGLERSPENYRELQSMVHYADPLFIGRNSAWIGSQAVILALAIAQFERVPTGMLLTLASTGVLVSVFWLLIAKSLGGRITWLDDELCRYPGSIHARYLGDHRSAISRRTSFRLMIYALPATFAGTWIMLGIIKCNL